MKVIIGSTTYTQLRELRFCPEADLSGASLPVCQFQADIYTDDSIAPGGYADLRDDLDRLWAHYWIADAYRLDRETVRISAMSPLALLDRVELDPVLYSGENVSDVFDDIFAAVPDVAFTMDSIYASNQVSGWCPKQTARARLQWVCLVIGAYVKQWADDRLRAVPIDVTSTMLQPSDVFWRPKLTYRDTVTEVRATAFAFAQGTPTATDEYVTDGTDYWIVTRTETSLANPNAPASAPANPVTLGDVTLVSSGYVSTVLSHLSTYYFDRTAVEADLVNNGAFWPGDRVTLPVDEDTLITGYIARTDFSFGLQAKSRVRLTAVETNETAVLTVIRMCGDEQIGLDKYIFPVGYQYSIQNPFVDKPGWNMRKIYRPTTDTLTGTMQAGSNTATVQYALALYQRPVPDYEGAPDELYRQVLLVISVDEVEEVTRTVGEDQITIGVIS